MAQLPIVQINHSTGNILDISEKIYLSDYHGLKITEVTSSLWSPISGFKSNIKGIRWLQLSFSNKDSLPINGILYLHNLHEVLIYRKLKNDSFLEVAKAGSLIPFSERQKINGRILEGIGNSAQASIIIPKGKTTLYLRTRLIYEQRFPSQIKFFPADVWEAEISPIREQNIIFQALILGALLIISLYHLLIFFQKRDQAYLLYALYTFFTSLVLLTETGVIQLYLFTEYPEINFLVKNSLVLLLIVTMLYFLFMQRFIHLSSLLPWLNTLVNRYLLLFPPLSLILIVLYLISPSRIYLNIGYFFPIGTFILASIIIFSIAKSKDTLAIYFIAGSFFLVTGVVINTIIFHLINNGFITELPFPRNYITEVGVVAEILIFSLGLGYRTLQQEKKNRYFEEMSALKARFFANISHEFRTPLTIIMGNTSMIKGKGNTKEKHIIQRNSQNLLRLVNQLLDLAKLESGSLKLHKIQADIIPYLKYLTESLHSTAYEKKVQLTFYNEAESLVMDFDEEKIQHIIYNLLSNALKFTPEDGKVILHTKKTSKNDQDFLQIKVKDNGIGIATGELDQIFNRFYQSDNQLNKPSAGSGIGLALCKDLVQMMDGEISVRSKIGNGTEFTILLPIHTKAPRKELTKEDYLFAPIPHENEEDKNESQVQSPAQPQLLLIEDNQDVAGYIESLLKFEYTIIKAKNGQEGIDYALENIPDIIISDVLMPIKNGYEVCNELKRSEQTSHIPIILLTAKATIEDRIKGLSEGADAYLTKPFNKEELFIRLEQLIAIRKSLQERYSRINYTSFSKQQSNSQEEIFLQKLIKVIEDRLDDPELAVAHLCRAVSLSNMQVNRKLKALTGKTPSRFIRSVRLEKAQELLKTSELNISEVAYAVGFNDPNYFTRVFSEEFGYPPSVTNI